MRGGRDFHDLLRCAAFFRRSRRVAPDDNILCQFDGNRGPENTPVYRGIQETRVVADSLCKRFQDLVRVHCRTRNEGERLHIRREGEAEGSRRRNWDGKNRNRISADMEW